MDSKRPNYQANAPPPPSAVDFRAAPPSTPYQHSSHHSQPSTPASAQPQAPPPHLPPPPTFAVTASAASNERLPPIQAPYAPAPPMAAHDPVPAYRHPPHSREYRDGPDYHYSYSRDARESQGYAQYTTANGHHHAQPGYSTQTPVNRSFSHDSSSLRTPTTPSQPAPYSAIPPDASQPSSHPPPTMDHAQPHNYPVTNGYPAYAGAPPPHHETHAPYVNPAMDVHHSFTQPQPVYAPYASGGYPSQKKKTMRATQACEQCRQRKQKCDEGQPCSFCKENNMECLYREAPPAKTDKNMEKILNFMEEQGSGQQEILSRLQALDDLDARLRQIERSAVAASVGARRQSSRDESALMRNMVPGQDLGVHRTAPHKLILLWPTVKRLLLDADIKDLQDSYVMDAEDRPTLRMWTRGEGFEERDTPQPVRATSPARSEDSGEGSTTSSFDGIGGTGFKAMPTNDIRRSEPHAWGGRKPDGTLDLDSTTITTLYDSYIRHMHVMHPFLDKHKLRHMIDNFSKQYSPDRYQKLRTGFAVNSGDGERPSKRQRSHGPGQMYANGGFVRPPAIERTTRNGIIFLVLALGKICTHKRPLPGPVPEGRSTTTSTRYTTDENAYYSSSPVTGAVKPSPGSTTSTPPTQPTPASNDGAKYVHGHSRRSSQDGVPSGSPRNLDEIPGLAYYAKALEVIGDQVDSNDLPHAQMFLLAGLYKGQLARVKESMSWFTMAGRVILNLLNRHKLWNPHLWDADDGDVKARFAMGQRRNKDQHTNAIVLAAWTCVQLESDILAELEFPSSGLQKRENDLVMPQKVPIDETYGAFESESSQQDHDNIMLFYTSQTFLRRRLNEAHKQVYGPDSLHQSLEDVRDMLKNHENILEAWRANLPDHLKWNDADDPAEDILSARLRAKYWGAKYVVNRLFLDYALHIMPYFEDDKNVPFQLVARDANGDPRDPAEVHLFQAVSGIPKGEIWQASKRCVDAAMQSTVALDGVPDRLIVTNIHGTAHAQFGNCLVLSATFTTYIKNELLLPAEHLQKLLERTIRFLLRYSPISPTLRIDAGVLTKIHHHLFIKPTLRPPSITLPEELHTSVTLPPGRDYSSAPPKEYISAPPSTSISFESIATVY